LALTTDRPLPLHTGRSSRRSEPPLSGQADTYAQRPKLACMH
jgi:hypothetical protein